MMKPIALIGFYGSGKTTVGRRVAGELGVPFYDLNDEIEKRSGMRIPQLYAQMGDSAFRRFESLALSSLAAYGGVVATTGGCVMMPYNHRLLANNFLTVYLNAPFELATAHINAARHPSVNSLSPTELFQLYELRKPQYQQLAHLTLDASQPLEAMVSQIIETALTGV